MIEFSTLVRGTVKLLARPLNRRRSKTAVVIRTYRGFGSRREICLFGRVLRQPEVGGLFTRDSLLGDLVALWRRMWRRGVRHATVEARFGDARQRAKTDGFGFFFIRLPIAPPSDPDRLWHQAVLELAGPAGEPVRAETDVLVAPRSAAYVVISDIDDTVVYTGVAQKIRMLWRLFFAKARSRVAFPGVGGFYRALHRGVSGRQRNPMLYVSRAPWSIYDALDTFFNLHDIPIGPVLYLRYWGMTIDHPLPRKARDHKLALIRQILEVYKDLPFILIGDSGQKDPEIYARILRDYPGRIRAIYIRDVGPAPERRRAIATLAEEAAPSGTAFLLAADSHAMAVHAARQGFIPEEAVDEVLKECRTRAIEAEAK